MKIKALLLVVLLVGVGAVFSVQFVIGSQGSGSPIAFEEVGSERGFEYETSPTGNFGNGHEGVYVTDYNNDNWSDVLAVGGETVTLYTNAGGEFERSNALPGVSITVKSALFFDYDNDGWEDLLLLPINGTATFLENRQGEFVRTDVGFDAHIDVGSAASAADYNGDGCLDVFVAQNGDWRKDVPSRARPSTDELVVENGSARVVVKDDTGNPNYLFAGNCTGFRRVRDAGIEGNRWSVATSFVDLTGDGRPDVHVANDYNYDWFYRNLGNGTFAGSKVSNTNRHGMASEIEDVNRDGRPDVFVTNIHYEHEESVQTIHKLPNMDNSGNSLLVNRGNGTFAAKERAYGVRDGGWGWATALVDLDNDGDRDLVHTTKYYMNTTEDGEPYQVETRPRLWERTSDRFERRNVSQAGFAPTNGKGLAHFDYDRDGDQDLVMGVLSGQFRLYENTGVPAGNWLQIDLRSDGHHTVVGSDIEVVAGNRTHHVYANTKADFLSQDTGSYHVGLGTHESVRVRVRWPDGRTLELENVSANQRIVVFPDGEVRHPEQ